MSTSLYALVSPEDDIIKKEFQNSLNLPSTKGGWRWLPVTADVEPEYDTETEKIYLDYDVQENSVLEYWKITSLNAGEVFDKKIKSGYLVEPENFTLKLEDADRALFAQMLALVKEGIELGFIDNNTPQTISDKDGERHIVTTLRFRQIMFAYGFYYKTWWDTLG